MQDRTSTLNVGAVVSVRGSVVDVRFDSHVPPIYLRSARGPLAETECLLFLAFDLGYLSRYVHQPIAAEVDEVARMLYALRVKVEQGDPQGLGQSPRPSGVCS